MFGASSEPASVMEFGFKTCGLSCDDADDGPAVCSSVNTAVATHVTGIEVLVTDYGCTRRVVTQTSD